VIQEGVHPSLHIQYKNFDLKQYFKEGRGCLPFPLRQALDRVDGQLDLLIYDAFPLPKAS
jgi:hypothetical protein